VMGTPLAPATEIPSVLVREQAASSPATDEDMLPFAFMSVTRLGTDQRRSSAWSRYKQRSPIAKKLSITQIVCAGAALIGTACR